jgi:L-fuconolactonase
LILVINVAGKLRSKRLDFFEKPEPPSSQDLEKAWRPYIETCIAAFGPQRSMFESNFPVDKGTCSYQVLWNAFKRIAAGHSADEKTPYSAAPPERPIGSPCK